MNSKHLEMTARFFKEMMQDPAVANELEERERLGIGLDWLDEIAIYLMEQIEKQYPEQYLDAKAHVERQNNLIHLQNCLEQ